MRTKEMNLSQVRRGMTVTVHKLQAKEEIRRRLLDIGLIEGTRVCCLYSGPSEMCIRDSPWKCRRAIWRSG